MLTNCLEKWKKTAIAILLPVILPLFGAVSNAQPPDEIKTIVSSGYSRIYDDAGAAKNAAIAEGLRFAIQKAAADLLSEDQVAENFENFSRALHRNPNRFVQEYRILREIQADRSYRVLIRSTVMMETIREALSAEGLQTRPEKLPSVLFMVAVRHIDDIEYSYWWQKGADLSTPDTATSPMAGIMKEEGFTIIDPRRILGNIDAFQQGLSLTATPADYEAAIFARRMGAHIVVTGTAEAFRGQNRMGDDIRTFKGNVYLRAINTQTGQRMTTVRNQIVSTGEDAGPASSNAMADAAFQAARKLSSRIDSLWRHVEEPSGGITISISGKNILPNLEQFRSTIADSRGISSVRTMRLSPDSARLWVNFRGTPDELAESLLMQSYGPFGINITEVSPDTLSLEMTRDMTSELLTE